jgi:ankyrin repeat protein/L-ascorbate metabolism protein UlaG (beta-lactamase superfamily)
VIELLVQKGANLDYRNEQGETALHQAASRGHMAAAQVLINTGMDIDVRDTWGTTPLTAACWVSLEMVQWLLDHGADVNAHTDSSLSPLSIAVFSGNPEIVNLLINSGADINWCSSNSDRPLMAAIEQGNTAIARILMDAGAEVDFVDRNFNRTPLHATAIRGDSVMTHMLLNHGAALEPKDSNGHTPLYYAIRYSNPTVAGLLRNKGAALLQPEQDIRPSNLLTRKPAEKEAAIWYLFHSGWAVKTANHFLVFDYFTPPLNPDKPCLANGRIDPNQIKNEKVLVFSSHEHSDHYDTTIFGWKDMITDIAYILGHRPEVSTEYLYTAPRTEHRIGDVKIRTITSTDAGVGFLVEVDGLVIFHAGDHANGVVGLHAAYTDEIDYLASLNKPIDLAFLPITGCSLGSPESVRVGVIYAIEKLHPRVFFPQHAMNAEYLLREFADGLKESGFTVQTACPENGGDCFLYRNQQLF